MNKHYLLTLVLVAGLAAGASAALHEVGPGKTHATIQSAVDAAGDNDEIVIYEGTYTETVLFLGLNNCYVHANPGDKVVLDGLLSLYNSSNAAWSDGNTFEGIWFDRSGEGSGWAVQHQYARSNTYQNCVFLGDGSGSSGVYGNLLYGLNLARHCTFYGLGNPYSNGYAGGLHVFDSIVAFNGAQPYNHTAIAPGVAKDSCYFDNPDAPNLPSHVGDTSGTIMVDPQFASIDPSSPDFLKLQVGSPCAGTAGNLNPGTGAFDMGALPVVPEPTCMLLLGLGVFGLRRRH